MSIYGNAVGGITGYGKTFILTDENGNEVIGTLVEDITIFDADPLTDIRVGKVAVTDQGVVVGSKNIPAYITSQGACMIFDGEEFVINDMWEYDLYDYTCLQCIVAPFNTSVKGSTAADKIVLNNNVYLTNSTDVLSTVTKNIDHKSISLNIVNNSGADYIIHYVMYREDV